MATYAEKLKDPRWQKKRLQIFERDQWKCTCCADTETTLNVHHKKYIGENPWDTPEEFLITVCEKCHGIYESIKVFEKERDIILLDLKALVFADRVRIWKATYTNGSVMLFFNSPEISFTMPFNQPAFEIFLDFINDGTTK